MSEQEVFEEMWRFLQLARNETEDEDSLVVTISCTSVVAISAKKSAANRGSVINRHRQKEPLTKEYANWSIAHFKARVQVNRDALEYILEQIRLDIMNTDTHTLTLHFFFFSSFFTNMIFGAKAHLFLYKINNWKDTSKHWLQHLQFLISLVRILSYPLTPYN